jgi:Calcineurin-like phosphoesterase
VNLLCTDPHLDANPANEYRWAVFDELRCVCKSYPVSAVYCLGDMTDKRDLFPARMVNRLVENWLSLPVSLVRILMGNHDRALTGPSFWEFLSEMRSIEYISRPLVHHDQIFLPFSPNPRVEWSGLPFREASVVFVHATRSGTIAENGHELTGQDLPPIPRRVKVYSGDVHNQQVVGNWTYIGASHPVKYGDDYACRFLLLDEETHEIVEEIPVRTIGKRVVEVSTLDDLALAEVSPGDQVRIRANVIPGSMDWGLLEKRVNEWAQKRGVDVTSIEGSYEVASADPGGDLSPEELLRAFSVEEKVPDDLLGVGLELLKEVTG